MQTNHFLNTSKIFFLICTVLITVMLLGGCGVPVVNENSKLNIVTVDFVQYDFVRSICKDNANITMITKPGIDIHEFEPSFSDIEKISNADIFVMGGGESDSWAQKILESINSKDIRIVRLMDYAVLLETVHSSYPHSHGDSSYHDHSGEEVCEDKHGFDEHIWTSPKNAVLMVDALCDAICEEEPECADYYRKNADEYLKEISAIDETLEKITKTANKNFAVVADKFPFLYLFTEYGLDYMAVFPGCSHENDASPSVMIDIIEEVRNHNLKYVFYTESSDRKIADTICNETGTDKLLLHSCQTVSGKEFESGITYVDIMKKNADNLKEALK